MSEVAVAAESAGGRAEDQPQPLVPSAFVTKFIGVPRSTINYWSYTDRWPEGFPRPIKVGKRLFYERAALERWLRSKLDDAQQARASGGS